MVFSTRGTARGTPCFRGFRRFIGPELLSFVDKAGRLTLSVTLTTHIGPGGALLGITSGAGVGMTDELQTLPGGLGTDDGLDVAVSHSWCDAMDSAVSSTGLRFASTAPESSSSKGSSRGSSSSKGQSWLREVERVAADSAHHRPLQSPRLSYSSFVKRERGDSDDVAAATAVVGIVSDDDPFETAADGFSFPGSSSSINRLGNYVAAIEGRDEATAVPTAFTRRSTHNWSADRFDRAGVGRAGKTFSFTRNPRESVSPDGGTNANSPRKR